MKLHCWPLPTSFPRGKSILKNLQYRQQTDGEGHVVVPYPQGCVFQHGLVGEAQGQRQRGQNFLIADVGEIGHRHAAALRVQYRHIYLFLKIRHPKRSSVVASPPSSPFPTLQFVDTFSESLKYGTVADFSSHLFPCAIWTREACKIREV